MIGELYKFVGLDAGATLRGKDARQLGMFSYVSVEERVPSDHPIHKLRAMVDVIPKVLDEVLALRYAAGGRESIPPERLLCAEAIQGRRVRLTMRIRLVGRQGL